VLNKLEKAISGLATRVSYIGQAVLMVMVLLVVVDIILRRFFNSPLPWSLEVIQVMLVVVVFFSVAYCGVQKAHVSIDVLTSRLPQKARTIVSILIHILGITILIYMAWGGTISAIARLHDNRVTGILPVPIYPFAFVVAFGCLLLALVVVVQLINIIIRKVTK
jgi:TRAP-type C4-dicarboxylate transport system permease small subunit